MYNSEEFHISAGCICLILIDSTFFLIFMQLAVKDLQDTIQYMHQNQKYKRVSSC